MIKKYIFILLFFSLPFNLIAHKKNTKNINFSEESLYFYIINRLETAVEIIKIIHKKNIFHTICNKNSEGFCTIFENTIQFDNKEIENCSKQIETTKNLKHFFPLWNSIKSDTKKLTTSYLKDFSLLILSIYNSVYKATYKKNEDKINEDQKSLALGAMAILFGNITSLHAFELLSIIDKLTLQIPKLLERYELTNSDITWKKWLKKYWWLPPLALSAVALEAVFIYQIAIGKVKLPKFRKTIKLLSKNNKES